MEATNERDRAPFENEPDAIIPNTNAVVFTPRFKLFEVWNLLKRPRTFHLFDYLPDSAKKCGIIDGGKVGIERLPERCVHAARASR